ncbi:MAG TPA: DUF2341 domain-containing protein, partial [Pirellulaceae bacterium]|nr:DUF2341 domain-containing protein [Pirellulaceae bacterium]
LHRDTFDFRQADEQGDDLRFSLTDGTPLVYQIEHWDAAAGVAAVWVRVPRIVGDSRQELRMHWGRADAKSESSGKAVFNASNGYLNAWHLHDAVIDETGVLESTDTGTTSVSGVIGGARHFPGGKGVFGGDKIADLPEGSASHSTSAWFRPAVPNTTVIGWGNEQAQGKVVMQFRSPPHIRMDCYFSRGNVSSEGPVPLGQWSHVVHTYVEGEARIYVNGQLDGVNRQSGSPLNVRRPARLWLGGWYHNYDFVGDLDEVRVSSVARSPDWIYLEYENQKPNQSLVGTLVQPGDAFSVSHKELTVAEGGQATVTAKAGGAQRLVWLLRRGPHESILATDRLSVTFDAGRVPGDETATLIFQAVYPDAVRSREIPVTIRNEIPEPEFVLEGPAQWDGRQTIAIVPRITNAAALAARGADR